MKKYLVMLLLLIPMAIHAAEIAVSNVASVPGVDWTTIIGQLSKAAIEIMLPVLVALIGWLGKKLLDMIHISIVRSIVKRLVLSAFQRFTSNTEKYDFVAAKISSKFKYLSQEEIKDYIEEAVVGLKAVIKTPAVK